MNLISDLKISGDAVSLTFTPTSSFCPMGIQLAGAIKKGLGGIEGVREVNVTVRGHVQEKQLNEMLKSM
jgi:metal-sulfur cluster biosynthetic enzyme